MGGRPPEEAPTGEESGVAELLAIVDALIANRAVVFGSLPPRGRDLDLLVGAGDEAALVEGLPRHGFLHAAGRWARFRNCTADVVDVVSIDSWGLPDEERAALHSEARPLAGTRRLGLPAPHHALLVLARRIANGGSLGDRQRARIGAALTDDANAFARAGESAHRWGLGTSLALLERVHREGRAPTGGERADAMAEGAAPGSLGRRLRRARRALGAPRRGTLIAFSGLDGSGKSSQTAHLRDALERLGYDAVAVWMSIVNLPRWLDAAAGVVKAPLVPLARLTSKKTRTIAAEQSGDGAAPASAQGTMGNPLTALRRRSSLLTFVWSMTITIQFVYRVARATWPGLLRGRVVICDRYTLDSWVAVLYKFGDQRRYRLQFAILRALSPSPSFAYFLDVPPDVASARKRDFEPDQNERRARLYRQRLDELGVRSLDGTRPREELCAEIAAEVWLHLSGTRSS